MKSIYLIRHAKSSWEDATVKDFDRTLNARGKKDAPKMGQWLKSENEFPDLIISSPAKRAKKTIQFISKEIGYSENKIHWEKLLYETDVKTWLKIVCGINNVNEKVFLVGHNNTLTEFANYLCDANILNVPTCGMVKIEFQIDQWSVVSMGTGSLIWFQFPKNLE